MRNGDRAACGFIVAGLLDTILLADEREIAARMRRIARKRSGPGRIVDPRLGKIEAMKPGRQRLFAVLAERDVVKVDDVRSRGNEIRVVMRDRDVVIDINRDRT